jgi:hypothetical protein
MIDAPPNSLNDLNASPKENNGRSWGTLPSMQHFEGKKGVLELKDGD